MHRVTGGRPPFRGSTRACAELGPISKSSHGRGLGPHGADERRAVGKSEAMRMPHAAVVRLSTGSRWFPQPFCSGTLVDDDTVLTAAHCVYREGRYSFPEIEVHPWMAAHSPFRPSTWASGHANCAWNCCCCCASSDADAAPDDGSQGDDDER